MIRKAAFILAVLFFVTALFSSCAAQKTDEVEIITEGELTIYMVADEFYLDWIHGVFKGKYPNVTVHMETFKTHEELELRLNTEISAGGGPDVIICNNLRSGIDLRRMADNGILLPLDAYFEADETFDESKYFRAALENGFIDNTRYYVTTAFAVPGIVTSEETIASADTPLPAGYTMQDLLDFLTGQIQKYADDPNRSGFFTQTLTFYQWLLYSGVLKLDFDARTVSLDREAFTVLLETYKMLMLEGGMKAFYLIKDLPVDGSEENFTNIISTFGFAGDVQNSGALYIQGFHNRGETPRILMLPTYEDGSQELAASVIEAAVNRTSKVPWLAYTFIRTAMDYEVKNVYYTISPFIGLRGTCAIINKEATAAYFNQIPMYAGYLKFRYSEESYATVRETAEEIDARITSCVSLSRTLCDMIDKSVEGYYNGTETLDTCYEDLINKLTLYVTE